MDILVVLEESKGAIHRMSLETIAAAQSIAGDLGLKASALALGPTAQSLASEASKKALVEILTVEHNLLSTYSADGYAEAVKQVIEQENPVYILFAHTYQSRDYVPKISARLNRPFMVDNISVKIVGGEIILTKQVFNSKLAADIVSTGDPPFLISFQSSAFQADAAVNGSASVRPVSVNLSEGMIRTQGADPFQEEAGGIDLTAADIIVSVGRGIGKEENLPMVIELAKALKGEVGSSRPVVDAGWLPSAHQIGSSGQTVSPKLYLALGISGAIQHVVGMKGSKSIVAINKDAEAPIFELADYGVVGDILEIIPKLTEALKS